MHVSSHSMHVCSYILHHNIQKLAKQNVTSRVEVNREPNRRTPRTDSSRQWGAIVPRLNVNVQNIATQEFWLEDLLLFFYTEVVTELRKCNAEPERLSLANG